MAKINENSFLLGISGMIGKSVVVKRRNNKPYLAAAPEWNPNRKPTPNQQKWTIKFKANASITKALATNPATRDAYIQAAAPGQSATS